MNEHIAKYLVFRLSSELYGAPLLTIREVLELQAPKYMPNMVPHFSGVINVRGAIVGVVDLRKKFNYPLELSKKAAMLLCDTECGPIAAIVDGIESVQELNDRDIEKNPPVKLKVQQRYLTGVAKKNEQLIILADLLNLLTEEELKVA